MPIRKKHRDDNSRTQAIRTLIVDASGVVHPVPTNNPNRPASHGDRIKVLNSLKESK